MQNHQHEILIVDDEINLLNAFRRTLHDKFSVTYCSCPLEALEKLKETNFALILSDISMPKMNGIEFMEKVNITHPETVKVILTGNASIEYAIDAVNKGHIFRFLRKPIDNDILVKTIKDSLEQYGNIQSRKELYSLTILKNQMSNMVNSLSKIVEIKDPYTSGHQQRVADMSKKAAEILGWDEDRIQGLYLAALVHDIGKIYVPAEFLNKPGRLSKTEFDIIKQHPSLGHEILREADFQWPIAEFVIKHHEKIDGTGYPNGLTDSDIPDESQIIAICDIYDAMCNRRPYREGLGHDEAVSYISSCAPDKLRQNLVDAVLSVVHSQTDR